MVWVGLEAEEYDRAYKDRTLLKRIFTYFAPYRRYLTIVVFFLIVSSLTTSFIPLIISFGINGLQTNNDIVYFLLLIMIIFIQILY